MPRTEDPATPSLSLPHGTSAESPAAMPVNATDDAMRSDHAAWRECLTRWREDIDRWQAEHRQAIERLARMQDVISLHGECLTDHASAFTAMEQGITAHESLLAAVPDGPPSRPEAKFAEDHLLHRDAMHRQQDAHERIGRHHEQVLACVQALEAATAAPL